MLNAIVIVILLLGLVGVAGLAAGQETSSKAWYRDWGG